MARGRVVVIGLAVLAAIAAFAFWWHGHGATQTAARDREPGSVVQGPSLPSTRSARLRFDHGGLRLEGQVVDEQLRPVGGASVVLAGAPERVATSDADGSFVFDQLAAGHYELAAANDDLYASDVVARLTEHSEPVIIHLRAGSTAIVHVVEADGGAPIAGAAVVRDRRRFVTGGDGIARVRGVRPGGDDLEVTADHHAPARVTLAPGDDPTIVAERTVALYRGAPVSGTVVGPDGQPVAEAEVAIAAITPTWRGTARTDASGAWHVDALAAGKHVLTASSETFGPAPGLVITHDGQHPLTGVVVHVATDGQLVGTVVDAAGAPVAGAAIACEREMSRLATGTSDASGHFEVSGLLSGAFDVWARAGTRASPPAHVALTKDGRVELRLVVEEASIAGTVVDGHGEPVAEARVLAFPAKFGNAPHSDVTNARGEFDLGGVTPGDWRLSASRPGQREQDIDGTTVHSGNRAVKLVLPDESAITGRVLLDGAPVPYFGVIVTAHADLSWQDSPATVRAPDGRFTRQQVPAGSWSVVIVGPGFARKVIDHVAVTAGRVADLGDIAVDHGRHLAGHVVDTTGAGVAGATVSIGFRDGYLAEDDPLRRLEQGIQSTQSDPTGAYSFDGIGAPPQSFEKLHVRATHPTLGTAPSQVVPDGDDNLDLHLIATGGIAGVLTGDHARYDAVNIRPETSRTVFKIVYVDAAGAFVLDDLAPGDYAVQPLAGIGGGAAPVMVTVVAHQRATVEIPCGGGVTAIVHVTGSCSAVVLIAHATMIVEECKDGVATFLDLAPGTYDPCRGDPSCPPIIVRPAPATQEFTFFDNGR